MSQGSVIKLGTEADSPTDVCMTCRRSELPPAQIHVINNENLKTNQKLKQSHLIPPSSSVSLQEMSHKNSKMYHFFYQKFKIFLK